MKIEKLNENKIRVTLNIEDLAERDIDYHSFMSNSIESQSIFIDMLNKAEKEVGFNTEDCRIMIEALALKDGRFVLIITKYSHNEENSPLNPQADTSKKKSLHIRRKLQMPETSNALYSFESFEAFCDFCEFLQNSTIKEELGDIAKYSKLYEYNSNYYLFLSRIILEESPSNFICTIITEFAHFVENPELYERKVTEYGSLIMKENAINTCIENFVLRN